MKLTALGRAIRRRRDRLLADAGWPQRADWTGSRPFGAGRARPEQRRAAEDDLLLRILAQGRGFFMSRIGREKSASLADAPRAGADHLAIFVEDGTALDPAHRRRDINRSRRIDDGRRGTGERPAGDGAKRKPADARRNGWAG
jgi:hypothetical protein